MRQVENQSRIVEAAEALVDSIGIALSHAAQIGKGLKGAAESFSRFANSINQRVLPRARKLNQLGLQPGKAIPGNLPTYTVSGHDDNLIEGDVEEVREAELPLPPRLVR